jgi:DNA-binding MarR family transcriptional regulator
MEQAAVVDSNETAARLRRAVTRLNRKLRQSALGGVSPAQASLLSSVEKLGRPSLGELAVREQIQPPSVTRLVRTLATAGLVTMTADSQDRRCTRVTLTSHGRRELSTIRRRKTEFLESKLRELTPEEQLRASELATLLEDLLGEP